MKKEIKLFIFLNVIIYVCIMPFMIMNYAPGIEKTDVINDNNINRELVSYTEDGVKILFFSFVYFVYMLMIILFIRVDKIN